MTVFAELGQTEVQRLASAVIPGSVAEPMGAYLFRFDEPGAELARHLDRVVFLEAFGNTPELLAEEYDPYEASSVFVCIMDHLRRAPAGAMRIVLPSPAGCKTFHDLSTVWHEDVADVGNRTGLALDPDRTWDVATLAVAGGYRGKAATGLVTLGLYQALTMLAWRSEVDWLVAILDVPVFRMIRWKLRMTFAGFTGVHPRPYLGSPASLPVWCSVDAGEQRLAETDPDLRTLLFDGVGIEPALRPLDLSRSLAVVR